MESSLYKYKCYFSVLSGVLSQYVDNTKFTINPLLPLCGDNANQCLILHTAGVVFASRRAEHQYSLYLYETGR